MYYTIYKVTNNKTGMNYIGKHQTKNLDDGYMGSGLLIKRAIKAHGIENFTKEILLICESEEEMNQKEKELVIVSDNSYNLCEGGKGGFSYINNNGLSGCQKGFDNMMTSIKEKHGVTNPSQLDIVKKKNSINMKRIWKEKPRKIPDWTGRKHSEETKEKMRQSRLRNLNK